MFGVGDVERRIWGNFMWNVFLEIRSKGLRSDWGVIVDIISGS